MTKIAIVEDNATIRESLIEFTQADPECRCVCPYATAESLETDSQTSAGHVADGHSTAETFGN